MGLEGEEELVRKLLGSPALVKGLVGMERSVAVAGYVDALRGLFGAAAALALVMVVVQAGTGWRGLEEEKGDEGIGGADEQDE